MKRHKLKKLKKLKEEGGRCKMKTGRMILVFVMLGLAVMCEGAPGTTDMFTITVTPSLNYSVAIDTGIQDPIDITMDFPGQVYCSTATNWTGTNITTASVRNNGNTVADWQASCSIRNLTGGKRWFLPATNAGGKDASISVDSCTVCILIADTATAISSINQNTDFGNADMMLEQGGIPQWHNLKASDFYYNRDGNNVVSTGGDTQRLIFYRIRMPSDVSNGDGQAITINIRAVTSASF